MGKGTHFLGQPMFRQLISLLSKSEILKFSRENGGERYVKRFDAWQHPDVRTTDKFAFQVRNPQV